MRRGTRSTTPTSSTRPPSGGVSLGPSGGPTRGGVGGRTRGRPRGPAPFARLSPRHIAGWYAQKHPDEDFAETFAVWLTPGSQWRGGETGRGAHRAHHWGGGR